jgi:hypothetical protein
LTPGLFYIACYRLLPPQNNGADPVLKAFDRLNTVTKEERFHPARAPISSFQAQVAG